MNIAEYLVTQLNIYPLSKQSIQWKQENYDESFYSTAIWKRYIVCLSNKSAALYKTLSKLATKFLRQRNFRFVKRTLFIVLQTTVLYDTGRLDY